MEQQANVPRRVKAESGQSYFQFLRDLLFRLACDDPARASHHLDKGQERCPLTVGRTASRQDEGALLVDALAELVKQTRLAHARLGREVDDADLRAGVRQPAAQNFQFLFAPNK